MEDEENVGYLTYEDAFDIFNYAEDGTAIDWMGSHYFYWPEDSNTSLDDIDWDLVEKEMDSEDIFNLMKECENEKDFHDRLKKKYGYYDN